MSHTEKRTQVYLSERLHRRALDYAHRSGDSLSGVVREALETYLTSRERTSADWDGDPVAALIGGIELPPLDDGVTLSDAVDRTVYDEETP